jgi:hypothetical protein
LVRKWVVGGDGVVALAVDHKMTGSVDGNCEGLDSDSGGVGIDSDCDDDGDDDDGIGCGCQGDGGGV